MCRAPFSLSQFKRPKAVDVSIDMRDPEADAAQDPPIGKFPFYIRILTFEENYGYNCLNFL